MVWLSKHEKKFQGAVFVDVDVKNFTETGCCLYARSQITNYDNVKTYNTLIFNIQLHSGFRFNKFQPENYISNPDETIIYLDDF